MVTVATPSRTCLVCAVWPCVCPQLCPCWWSGAFCVRCTDLLRIASDRFARRQRAATLRRAATVKEG